MYYNRRREIVKNVVYITAIFILVVVSTYCIYNKFQTSRNIDFNSESLDVTYHEATGDKITLNRITPVTDSVGLSSKAYNITLKNNLTEKVDFKIKIVDDLEFIMSDGCSDNLISLENIRISIKDGNKENKIYNLNELKENILLESKLDALEVRELAVRVWIGQDSILPLGSSMHYHGIMQVMEEDNSIAINK